MKGTKCKTRGCRRVAFWAKSGLCKHCGSEETCEVDGCERPAPYTGNSGGDVPMKLCEMHYQRHRRKLRGVGAKSLNADVRVHTSLREEQLEAAVMLLDAGWSVHKVAAGLSVPYSTVRFSVIRRRRHLLATDCNAPPPRAAPEPPQGLAKAS